MSKQRRFTQAPAALVRRCAAVAAIALVGAAGAAATAAADPVRPPKTFQAEMTCTGLGDVLVTNIEPAQTEAFQVVGTNTVLLVGSPIERSVAPGIAARALAAGTTCTITAAGPPGALEPVDPFTFRVVIVNG